MWDKRTWKLLSICLENRCKRYCASKQDDLPIPLHSISSVATLDECRKAMVFSRGHYRYSKQDVEDQDLPHCANIMRTSIRCVQPNTVDYHQRPSVVVQMKE
jgi:hypothetical protein